MVFKRSRLFPTRKYLVWRNLVSLNSHCLNRSLTWTWNQRGIFRLLTHYSPDLFDQRNWQYNLMTLTHIMHSSALTICSPLSHLHRCQTLIACQTSCYSFVLVFSFISTIANFKCSQRIVLLFHQILSTMLQFWEMNIKTKYPNIHIQHYNISMMPHKESFDLCWTPKAF